MAFIVQIRGDQQQEFKLGASATIGRHPANTIKFHDPVLSRSHAKIWRTDDGRYLIADLGSSHGIWVRGKKDSEFKMVPEHVLSDGDRIILGSTQLLFRKAGITLDTRRWSVRTPCRLPVRVEIEPGKKVEATATDISQVGMRIDLKRQLEPETIVGLSIAFPGMWRRLRMKARVKHSSSERGMGVAFLFPSKRVHTRLTIQIARLLVAKDMNDED